VFLSVQCFESRMPSYSCKHSCYVIAYLHKVVLISYIRLLLANYLLFIANILKSACRQTTARPGPWQAMAHPGPWAPGPCSSLVLFYILYCFFSFFYLCCLYVCLYVSCFMFMGHVIASMVQGRLPVSQHHAIITHNTKA